MKLDRNIKLDKNDQVFAKLEICKVLGISLVSNIILCMFDNLNNKGFSNKLEISLNTKRINQFHCFARTFLCICANVALIMVILIFLP